jgi:hypothetical protein
VKKLIALLILGLGLLGCSTVKPVELVTDKKSSWSVGQHDLCLFKDRLICAGQPTTNQDKPVNNLIENGVYVLNEVAEDEEQSDIGVYDVKLSTSPEAYSVWNCVKTGKASPAVDCVLVKAPDANQKTMIAKQEKEEKEAKAASQTLYSLDEEQVQQRCGAPLKKTTDSISVMAAYKGNSKFVGLRFDTVAHRLHSYEPKDFLEYAGLNSDPPTDLNFKFVLGDSKHWQHAGGPNKQYNLAGARLILQELPCLKK